MEGVEGERVVEWWRDVVSVIEGGGWAGTAGSPQVRSSSTGRFFPRLRVAGAARAAAADDDDDEEEDEVVVVGAATGGEEGSTM